MKTREEWHSFGEIETWHATVVDLMLLTAPRGGGGQDAGPQLSDDLLRQWRWDAWDELFLAVRSAVKCEKLPHGHDLDDVVTDALSETAKALDRISGPQGILRYSVCVVRNLIRTLWKEEKSHPVASLPGDSAAIAHFQDQIDYEELTAGLAHGLGSSDLMLFQEWLEAGLNTREVRKQSRASESVFSTRFSRLRGKLRKSLRRRRTASDGPSSS